MESVGTEIDFSLKNTNSSLLIDQKATCSNQLGTVTELESPKNSSLSLSAREGDSIKQSSLADNIGKAINKKKEKKAKSYQDLHSDYTKERYKHVKSKVREYIDNIKALDQQKKNISRYRSLPETLSECGQISNPSYDNSSSEDLRKKIVETNEEMARLKNLNEYLQEKVEEKMVQLARLKRCSDSMRIELLQIKEKQRNSNAVIPSIFDCNNKYHIPIPSPRYFKGNSKSTQTCNSIGFDENSQEYEHISVACSSKVNKKLKYLGEYSNVNLDLLQQQSSQEVSLRNLSSMNGSDSAIESELDQEIFEFKKEDSIKSLPKRKKQKLINKKKWDFVFTSCTTAVVPCCQKNESFTDEYFYSRIPDKE